MKFFAKPKPVDVTRTKNIGKYLFNTGYNGKYSQFGSSLMWDYGRILIIL